MREPVNEVAKPPSTIFERSWQSREVPADQKRGNITCIFKKGATGTKGRDSLSRSVVRAWGLTVLKRKREDSD